MLTLGDPLPIGGRKHHHSRSIQPRGDIYSCAHQRLPNPPPPFCTRPIERERDGLGLDELQGFFLPLQLLCWLLRLHTRPQMQLLNGHVPRAAVANSRVTGRLAETTQLKLAIGLPLRNAAELDSLLAEMNDPTSSKYHQYLTPAQFAAQFGPTEADYVGLIEFARENGLMVTATHPNRMLLDVAGSTATVEKALHVNMVTYLHPVRGAFYAPDREPSLDTEVATLDISGLENYDVPQPMGLQRVPMTAGATPYVTGSGPGGYFIGKDFRAAYAPGVTLTGTNQVVGLLEFDGFYAADVQKNFAAANQTPVPVQTVLLDGFSGAAGSDNTEVTLDIMMAAYMAPGLSKVIVYEGTTPNDILNRMATDNLAQQISSSWGYNPVNATTEQIFKEYIAQGQSVLQASGDSGAYKNGGDASIGRSEPDGGGRYRFDDERRGWTVAGGDGVVRLRRRREHELCDSELSGWCEYGIERRLEDDAKYPGSWHARESVDLPDPE